MEAEPELSRGLVPKARGGGAGDGDVPAASAKTQEALSWAKLSASNLFSNFNFSFLRMGQLQDCGQCCVPSYGKEGIHLCSLSGISSND
jgi:hypothetical protein